MKTKALGRTGLELSAFGLLVASAESAPSPSDVANWCDIPLDLDAENWGRVAGSMARKEPHVIVRVGPRAWDRSMLNACGELLTRIGRTQVDIWQLSMLDVERVKAGEPLRTMIKLREMEQVRFLSLRVGSIADAMWVVQHTPAHVVTVDCAFETKAWSELLGAAAEAGAGIIGTARTAGDDVARARELLASTSITAFSWPARLP